MAPWDQAVRALIAVEEGPQAGEWRGSSKDGLVGATIIVDTKANDTGIVCVYDASVETRRASPAARAVAAAFSEPNPRQALLDSMRSEGAAIRVTLTRRVKKEDLESGRDSTYGRTKGDGLCCYRVAYQVYRFYKFGTLEDVDLRDESAAEAFAKWIEACAAAGDDGNNAESTTEKAKLVVEWIRARDFSAMFKGTRTQFSEHYGWGSVVDIGCLLRGAAKLEPSLTFAWEYLRQPLGLEEPTEDCERGGGPGQSGVVVSYAHLLADKGPKLYVYYDSNHFWLARPVRTDKDAEGLPIDDSSRIEEAVEAAVDAFVESLRGSRQGNGADEEGEKRERVVCGICGGKSILKTSLAQHRRTASHIEKAERAQQGDNASTPAAKSREEAPRPPVGPRTRCGSCKARQGEVGEAGCEWSCARPGCFEEVGEDTPCFRCSRCKSKTCLECAVFERKGLGRALEALSGGK